VDRDEDFAEYVAARRPALVRTAVLLGCSSHEAEDLAQTALVRCYRSWSRVRGADDPDAYVYRILVNALRDSRSRKSSGEIPSDVVPHDAFTGHAEDVARGHVVRRALLSLSEQHRAVLVLRFFADLGERQVAEILGVPPGTVKSRTARALAALSAHDDIADLHGERRT
jgi:RNA polymerase sigma-70 factor (sigma-E family)